MNIRQSITCLLSIFTIFTFPFLKASAQESSIQAKEFYEFKRQLNLPSGSENSKIDASLFATSGKQRVVVHLGESVAERGSFSDSAQARNQIKAEQDSVLQELIDAAPSCKVFASTQLVLNALFVEIDAGEIPDLAAIASVKAVQPIAQYKTQLASTVPHVGAALAQSKGFTGKDVVIAVVDSGVDYTHLSLGGSGNYSEAYGESPDDPKNTTADGLFPTEKVIGGYDFIGEYFPDKFPDEDPIDYQGHGTHVADIIAGVNGVAPDAKLMAFKVCESLGFSCDGAAIVQAIEYAVDPNQDGDTSDKVDIINMSLGGASSNPFDQSMALAVENASRFGVLTVAAAGNGGDGPFFVSGPSVAQSAISVAQTEMPYSLLPITMSNSRYDAIFQGWSTLPTEELTMDVISSDVAFGSWSGCEVYPENALSGKALLTTVDNECSIDAKIINAQNAGASAVILGNPETYRIYETQLSSNDTKVEIPVIMVGSGAFSNALFDMLISIPVSIVFDPSLLETLTGKIRFTSSRGPGNGDARIKPDIAAPGQSYSALVGTSFGNEEFGGTSGATPMVAGAAALMIEAINQKASEFTFTRNRKGLVFEDFKDSRYFPATIKALLANNAETNIRDEQDRPAPITRRGTGELRVDRALSASSMAWEKYTKTPSLSFGYVDILRRPKFLSKKIEIRNFDDEYKVFNVSSTFLNQNDVEKGAVKVKVWPNKVWIPPHGKRSVRVAMHIDPTKLEDNHLSSANDGNSGGDILGDVEFDGFIHLKNENETLALPWHIIPRRVSHVKIESVEEQGELLNVNLLNYGLAESNTEVFTLAGLSPREEDGPLKPTYDIKSIGVKSLPLGPENEDCHFIWGFNIATWDTMLTNLGVMLMLDLDVNDDGEINYTVFGNFVFGDGTIWVWNRETGYIEPQWLTEHATNSNNVTINMCSSQLGLDWEDYNTTKIKVTASSVSRGGGSEDKADSFVVIPGTERFSWSMTTVPGESSSSIGFFDQGNHSEVTPALGWMLVTDSKLVTAGGATKKTSVLYHGVEGADLSVLEADRGNSGRGDLYRKRRWKRYNLN